MITLDAHCDAPSQMLRCRDFNVDNAFAQVDFPKMKRGGMDASFFAAFVPSALHGEAATMHAERLIDAVYGQVVRSNGAATVVRSATAALKAKADGVTAIFLGIENASSLNGSIPTLKHFYSRGVRYVTLTHSRDNDVCDSCTDSGRWGGLSPWGRILVPEMNRMGMLVDLAHSADSTMQEVLSLSKAPVAYTHGCCRALASHRRNISDKLMRGIAQGGGIVCMSIYPNFLDDDYVKLLAESELEEKDWIEDEFSKDPSNPEKEAAWIELQKEYIALRRPGAARVAEHIEHAVNVAGMEHVGIGTDYDGIQVTADGFEDVSKFGLLHDELRRRGFSGKEISMIAGENMLRVLRNVRKCASRLSR